MTKGSEEAIGIECRLFESATTTEEKKNFLFVSVVFIGTDERPKRPKTKVKTKST